MRHVSALRIALAAGLAPALVLALILARPAAGQHGEHGGHADHSAHEVAGLGAVHFPTTCASEVQESFDRGVALLHSFGYEAARAGFEEVARRDPSCGMAHWGVAMSWYHPLWAPPTASELAAGTAAAKAAAERGAKSARERAYVAAISAFYANTEAADHRTRAAAYRDAMRALRASHPDDSEAAIFHALALLGTAPPTDPSYAQQKEAAAILNGLLAEQPRHPGIVHYLIHSFDYPQLAALALQAARTYADIAPDSAHARHMPSHIFVRLGLWDEAVRSNLDSAETALGVVAQKHPGAASFDALHAYDYLAYAYLQQGRDEAARQVVAKVAQATSFDEGNFAAGYAVVAAPARWALERRQWAEAAALQPPQVTLPWDRFPYAPAISHFAAAVGAARAGDAAAARGAVERLAALQSKVAAAPPAGPYDWAGQVESLRLAAAGWLAHAEGKDDDAVSLLTAAAELEERVGKHPVSPGAVLPAREQLGDLLLELGRQREALAAYERALVDAPNRFNGLAGAARAAELAGEAAKARELYGKLAELCRAPECVRPEAKRAAAFLAASG
jgi:tetratricopeptide (TPR) repeat protein